MLACRAETRMNLPIIHAQGRKPSSRKLLQAMVSADIGILPDLANRVLVVRLLGLGTDARDRRIASLLDELNATETIYPGNGLRMVLREFLHRQEPETCVNASSIRLGSLNPSSFRPGPKPARDGSMAVRPPHIRSANG